MFKLRTSKYRHVFCDQPKPEECYQDFRLSTVTGEQQYIKASAKYFCVGMFGGGGPVVVNRLDRPGRFDDLSSPYLTGHSGAVNDFDWSPFDDSMLATASDDTNIKVWQIPDDFEPIDASGNAKKGTHISESAADLTGHTKKVTLLRFHPTANNTLLSTGADYTVKIWDVESSADVVTFDDVPNLVHDIVWDARGDMAAFSCKDKNVRVIDPRTAAEAHKFQAHDGVKSVKLFYVHDTGKIVTCGASKQSSREIRIWDLKDLSRPLHTEPVDSAAGAMIPLWDPDTSVFYLCGKGDGIVRLYEYEDKAPFIYKLNDGFRSNIPGKGYCLVPKRGLNVMQHETARVLKVTNNAGVHPLRFHVPRKSDAFQEDIFPPTASAIPSHSFSEWMAGSSKDPVPMSLSPGSGGANGSNGAANGHSNGHGGGGGMHANGGGANGAVKKVFKSASTLNMELDEANKTIEYLKAKLTENGIAF